MTHKNTPATQHDSYKSRSYAITNYKYVYFDLFKEYRTVMWQRAYI